MNRTYVGHGNSVEIDPQRTAAITSDDDGTVLGLRTVLRLHQHWNTDLRETNSCTDSITTSTLVDGCLICEKTFQRISE